MIGQKLSDILSEIEETLWEFEFNHPDQKPNYTTEGFRASIKIFMSALLDKMWELQSDEHMDIDTRMKMAEKAGHEIRKIVKIYTDIDTHQLFELHKT